MAVVAVDVHGQDRGDLPAYSRHCEFATHKLLLHWLLGLFLAQCHLSGCSAVP